MLSDVNDSNVMFNIQLKVIIPPQKNKKCLSLIINYRVYPYVTTTYNKYNLVIQLYLFGFWYNLCFMIYNYRFMYNLKNLNAHIKWKIDGIKSKI